MHVPLRALIAGCALATPADAATYTLNYATTPGVAIAEPDEFFPSDRTLSIEMVLDLPGGQYPFYRFDVASDPAFGEESDDRILGITVFYEGEAYSWESATRYNLEFDFTLGGGIDPLSFSLGFNDFFLSSAREGQYGARWSDSREPPFYKYYANGTWTVPAYVPVPATAPLLVLALGALLALRARRRGGA